MEQMRCETLDEATVATFCNHQNLGRCICNCFSQVIGRSQLVRDRGGGGRVKPREVLTPRGHLLSCVVDVGKCACSSLCCHLPYVGTTFIAYARPTVGRAVFLIWQGGG